MELVSRSQSSPEFQTTRSDLERLLREGGTTDSFGTAPLRNMHIGKRLEDTQDVLQKELYTLKDVVLL